MSTEAGTDAAPTLVVEPAVPPPEPDRLTPDEAVRLDAALTESGRFEFASTADDPEEHGTFVASINWIKRFAAKMMKQAQPATLSVPGGAKWADLNALALRLSEAGQLVTQIHFDGVAPGTFDFNDAEATIHNNVAESCVVTSDGKRHYVD